MSQIDFNPNVGNLTETGGATRRPTGPAASPGQKFSQVLRDSIAEVNQMQVEADRAINAVGTGRTDNVAEVMAAWKKSDLAFKTLLQIRNRLLEAYNEVRNMRM